MSILVVGSVAYDKIVTPFDKRDRALGGSATYFSLAAQHFSKINLVGVIGDDFNPSDRKILADKDIDLQGLEVADGKTFFWSGEYMPNWNERITHDTQLNVFEHFKPKIPQAYREMPYVFLGNIAPTLQMEVLEQIETAKLVALDSMNLWMDIALDDLVKVLSKVDVLLINDSEARQLSGKNELLEAYRTIREMGPRILCIKQGEHGAILFSGDDIFIAPAYPLCKVVDPTGAGDSFAGGFIGYLASTDDISFDNLKKAVIYGSVMGSFTVESFSVDRCAAVTRDQIGTRYREFVEMTHFHQ